MVKTPGQHFASLAPCTIYGLSFCIVVGQKRVGQCPKKIKLSPTIAAASISTWGHPSAIFSVLVPSVLCPLPRGEYFSKNQYFFTNPKNGPARDSRDTLSLDSNISARTQKKAIFLHMVVIFLHGPKKKCVFYAQLNKKLAKSTLYHIIHCFACFSMI